AAIVPPLAFGESDDATRPCDTIQFLHELRPGCGRKKIEEASIDQVERTVGKSERLQDIHYLKTKIVQTLYPRQRICIVDHRLTDVEPHYLDLGIGKGHFLRPAARPTGDIENALDAGQVFSFREEAAHTTGDETVLVE